MSEMLIALLVIAVVLCAIVLGVIYIARTANKMEKEDEQGTLKFVATHGLRIQSDHSIVGEVHGVAVEFGHDLIPGKPSTHGDQIDKREKTRPTLRVTGDCAGGLSWMLCPTEDLEFLAGKFSISDAWAPAGTDHEEFDSRYTLVIDGGIAPAFVRDADILQSLIDWDLQLAIADGNKIVAHAHSRSVGLKWLGSFDALDQSLHVILAMCRVGTS
jgi:hypothetical protein